MESKKSNADDGVGGYASQFMSKDKAEDKKIHTVRKCLDVLQHEALVYQEIPKRAASSTLEVLGNQSKLQKASAELTKASKKGDFDVVVQACIAAMISLLEIYSDQNLGYSWRTASKVVSKIQGHGTHHMQCICEWVMDFLRSGDLPLHQLNWKQWTILDDKDLAEEIKI